jgi:hypothetical protein
VRSALQGPQIGELGARTKKLLTQWSPYKRHFRVRALFSYRSGLYGWPVSHPAVSAGSEAGGRSAIHRERTVRTAGGHAIRKSWLASSGAEFISKDGVDQFSPAIDETTKKTVVNMRLDSGCFAESTPRPSVRASRGHPGITVAIGKGPKRRAIYQFLEAELRASGLSSKRGTSSGGDLNIVLFFSANAVRKMRPSVSAK